ncbi:hypothetical protein [Flavisolibacter ginsenosidimutans]|uniref:hypothetical protein n=1 Tax=Flavisolibacter ginsenosidimutans TaxID=661481 RepID=UPI001D13E0AA|nr:hypothetical protein [Flavisolibacter ginsenosidimutans]
MLLRKKMQAFLSFCTPLIAFLSFTSASAQSTSKENFENAIVKEFCDSFESASPRLTKDNMTVEMGAMIVPLMSRYNNDVKNYWGIDMSSKEGMRSFGEKVGQLAALKCPAFLTFIKNNLQDIVSENGQGSKTYSGKILKIEGQPFAYLLVQNNQGRTDKLYWLEYFEGANKLTTQPATALNKAVTISYKEMEVYQAVEKEYKTIKVISKIEWKP